MPSQVLNFQTLYQVLHSFPDTCVLSTLPMKVFGCSVFVHIHAQHRSKLYPRALKFIFVGYSSNQKGYKYYSPVTQKFYNTMDVSFEQQPYYPKTDIRGENCTQEYQLWEIDALDSSSVHDPSSIESSQTPLSHHSHGPSLIESS